MIQWVDSAKASTDWFKPITCGCERIFKWFIDKPDQKSYLFVVQCAFTASWNTSHPIRILNSRFTHCFLTLMYCPISIQDRNYPFYVFKHDVRAVRKKEREMEWENSSGRYTASGTQKTIVSLPPVTCFTFKQQISFTQLISAHWLWSAVEISTFYFWIFSLSVFLLRFCLHATICFLFSSVMKTCGLHTLKTHGGGFTKQSSDGEER